MVLIAVTGEASTSLAAERATAHLRVEATGADRADVVARAAHRHAELLDQARTHVASGAATGWEAQDVTTGTVHEWVEGDGDRHRQRLFRATANVRVHVVDVAVLGSWLLEVGAQEDVAVDHVSWDLTEVTRTAAVENLRVRAVRDAVARAATYAGALGLTTPRLTAVYEDGLRPGGPGGGPVPMMAMRAVAHDGGGGLELQPQDVELTVTVSADLEA
ncbi:SIMPL domain-containing protein [Litorihabitans aurantiacus]|uniref:DUF541 domain-containing protein n=1 Tax=Litorihabitans aurantiacus TaxID=1930061 RepID=A0AA38CWM4_9MICO|nr:SIMPL domain-containing protein [Litorihabitans aurantiacus]GMA30066.1 hypothetical protein GCM10025875_00580 [Litorihabitans aurantiacus]GMA33565.1 hypothetical protein GCM10025875_35570 [Litorihabitans aurantiacus]